MAVFMGEMSKLLMMQPEASAAGGEADGPRTSEDDEAAEGAEEQA